MVDVGARESDLVPPDQLSTHIQIQIQINLPPPLNLDPDPDPEVGMTC